MQSDCALSLALPTDNDKQENNINPFIFQSPPLAVCLFTHKRLLQCCDNLFIVYVSLAIENAERWLKAETAGSLTSLSGPARYPDRKQLDAPLNTTLKNTWAENAKATATWADPVENVMDFFFSFTNRNDVEIVKEQHEKRSFQKRVLVFQEKKCGGIFRI